MKPIVLSKHAQERLHTRGTDENEVREAVLRGSGKPARDGKIWCRLNFEYKSMWHGKYYAVKQVAPIIVEKADRIVVVTVYTFYF